ncbi:beta-aspartyl-peptidase [Phocicoccus pinnipedialis]|uniref:Isoaspartyl dipeptidase n=1 Tax=Phocicoccus pinnipedialis TaxID=110845 RepID=A0A6V7R5U0_9BACL|nr:beta-aspartyl-peptidase [Jeotgalicoccus pinnipedialis]MBP1939786.1 beta-aspartyl-dipeptidase (metallo-type) [Jeotgalicoccus pinnipedialis]CAD2072414.1 Isoaspartyl dipeptidase [Jeotgalicoccus pinnipedialis]
MFKVLENAEVFSPSYKGRHSVLLLNDKIIKIGEIDIEKLRSIDLPIEIYDAKQNIVTPGIVEPHIHLLGGGGESGFHTRTPESKITEIVSGGITTVVGLIGTDGITRPLSALLAKTRALETEGITAYMYTGNYHLPVATLTGSIKEDITFIDKIIGTAEIAINDFRSSIPTEEELARIIADTTVAGMLAQKAGVTHFHVGGGKHGLKILHDVIEKYDVKPQDIYVTHIDRTTTLLEDAMELAKTGAYIDITASDTTKDSVNLYKAMGGDMSRLTISTDGYGSLPEFDSNGNLIGYGVAKPTTTLEQIQKLLRDGGDIQEIISLVTSNVARVLKLNQKGRLEENRDADIMILNRDTFELEGLLARGNWMIKDKKIIVKDTF